MALSCKRRRLSWAAEESNQGSRADWGQAEKRQAERRQGINPLPFFLSFLCACYGYLTSSNSSRHVLVLRTNIMVPKMDIKATTQVAIDKLKFSLPICCANTNKTKVAAKKPNSTARSAWSLALSCASFICNFLVFRVQSLTSRQNNALQVVVFKCPLF